MAKKKKEEVKPSKKETKPSKKDLVQAEADAVDFTDEVYYGTQNDDGTWNPWDPKGKPTISRAAAVLLGFRRYFTGKECQNGHLAPRKTKGATCIECNRIRLRERNKKKRQEDPEYRARMNEKAKAKAKARKEAKA